MKTAFTIHQSLDKRHWHYSYMENLERHVSAFYLDGLSCMRDMMAEQTSPVDWAKGRWPYEDIKPYA